MLLASIGKVSRGPAAGRAEDSSGGAAGDPAARVGKSFESLDYEEYDDTVYRADQAASSSLDSLLYSANKYLVCFAVGEQRRARMC